MSGSFQRTAERAPERVCLSRPGGLSANPLTQNEPLARQAVQRKSSVRVSEVRLLRYGQGGHFVRYVRLASAWLGRVCITRQVPLDRPNLA